MLHLEGASAPIGMKVESLEHLGDILTFQKEEKDMEVSGFINIQPKQKEESDDE